MPLPARVERLAAEFYNQNWESEQYNAFIAGETKYFESEYRSEKELVMEYFDEDWVNLAKYVEEKERLDISEARNIFRERKWGDISETARRCE
ncbi:hypothetical protein BASA83_011820 [Batrachochytrium salamandrivorans]|nr:hypothetical protein BASA83_011820 [Batrachochytrium salamandrivorans]